LRQKPNSRPNEKNRSRQNHANTSNALLGHYQKLPFACSRIVRPCWKKRRSRTCADTHRSPAEITVVSRPLHSQRPVAVGDEHESGTLSEISCYASNRSKCQRCKSHIVMAPQLPPTAMLIGRTSPMLSFDHNERTAARKGTTLPSTSPRAAAQTARALSEPTLALADCSIRPPALPTINPAGPMTTTAAGNINGNTKNK
jgi:hypothetical protein